MAISKAQAPVQDNCRRGEREEARREASLSSIFSVPEAFTPLRSFDSIFHQPVRDRLTRKLSIGGYITRAQMFIYLKAKQYPVFRLRAMITLIIVCLVQTR